MKNLRLHLQYKWFVYIAIALVVVILWTSIFSSLETTALNRRVYVAVFGEGYDTVSATTALEEKLSNYTDQEIEECMFSIPYLQEGYGAQLALYTHTMEYDIVIVSQSYMYDTIGADYFVQLPPFVLDSIEAEVYYENGKPYGFVIADGNIDNNFSSFYSGEERCFVFITLETQNARAINGKGDEGDDAALATIRYLTEGAR